MGLLVLLVLLLPNTAFQAARLRYAQTYHGNLPNKGNEGLVALPTDDAPREPPSSGSNVEIAVVGSGPLTDADRALIANAKEVYRFNSMNNLKKNEKVGKVFVRRGQNNGDSISHTALEDGACPLIKDADGLIVVVDSGPEITPSSMDDLKNRFGDVRIARERPGEALTLCGNTVMPNTTGFSSSFVGVVHVLNSSPLAMRGKLVHVFGMNWKANSKLSGGRPLAREKEDLMNARQVRVHLAPDQHYKLVNNSKRMLWHCEGGYEARSSVGLYGFTNRATNTSDLSSRTGANFSSVVDLGYEYRDDADYDGSSDWVVDSASLLQDKGNLRFEKSDGSEVGNTRVASPREIANAKRGFGFFF